MEKRIGIVARDSRLKCLNCLNICQVDQLYVEEENLDLGFCPICGIGLAVQRMTIGQTEIAFTEDAKLL